MVTMSHLDRIGIRPRIRRYVLRALFSVALGASACTPAQESSTLYDYAKFSYSVEGCVRSALTDSGSADLDLRELGKRTIMSKDKMKYTTGDKVQIVTEGSRRYNRVLNLMDRGYTKLFADLDAIDNVFNALGSKIIFTDGYSGLYGTNSRMYKTGSCE